MDVCEDRNTFEVKKEEPQEFVEYNTNEQGNEDDTPQEEEQEYENTSHEDITIKVEPSEILWFNIKEESAEEELPNEGQLTGEEIKSICQDPLLCGARPEDINNYLKSGNESLDKGYLAMSLNLEYETGLKYCLEQRSFSREGERFFGCCKCSFVTNNEDGLRSHFWCHFEDLQRGKFDQPLGEIFKRKTRRKNDAMKLFKCSCCDYTTNRKDTLKVHQLKHSDDKPLKCDKCEYRTNRKDTLKIHALKHSDMKLWKCGSCDYETNHKSELRIHTLKHNDTKLFQCDQCSYQTNRKSHLKGHLLTHSKGKRFQCSECVYTTNQKSNLKGHMLVHTELKVFKCIHCQFETNQKSTLNRHLLRTHSEKA